MKKLRFVLAFVPLPLFILALWNVEQSRAEFTWNSLEWDTFFRQSNVYNKVGADTIYANVYENAAPGVEVGDSQPGNCNANDGFRGVLWYDTSGADSGLKWCNNEDGSYNWDPIALDADGDGIDSSIDEDDGDDGVFARNLVAANVKGGTEIGPSGSPLLTGTLVFAETNTYSGTNPRVTVGTNLFYLSTREPDNDTRANVHFACIQKGDSELISWTEATGATTSRAYANIENSTGRDRVGEFLDNTAITNFFTVRQHAGYVDEFTCRGFSG